MKANKRVKATFFRRFVAYLLDAFIVSFIIGLPLAAEAFNEEKFTFEFNGDFDIKDLIRTTAVGVLTVLYWSVFEYKLKQSPGKMLLKLYVNPTDKNLTFSHAVVRNLSKMSGLLLLIDCLYMVFKKTNQRYLETIAKTEVLRYE